MLVEMSLHASLAYIRTLLVGNAIHLGIFNCRCPCWRLTSSSEVEEMSVVTHASSLYKSGSSCDTGQRSKQSASTFGQVKNRLHDDAPRCCTPWHEHCRHTYYWHGGCWPFPTVVCRHASTVSGPTCLTREVVGRIRPRTSPLRHRIGVKTYRGPNLIDVGRRLIQGGAKQVR